MARSSTSPVGDGGVVERRPWQAAGGRTEGRGERKYSSPASPFYPPGLPPFFLSSIEQPPPLQPGRGSPEPRPHGARPPPPVRPPAVAGPPLQLDQPFTCTPPPRPPRRADFSTHPAPPSTPGGTWRSPRLQAPTTAPPLKPCRCRRRIAVATPRHARAHLASSRFREANVQLQVPSG